MSPATQILRANGLTVTDVASAADMTPGAVSRVLCGRAADGGTALSLVIDAVQTLAGRAVAIDVAGEIELSRAVRAEARKWRALRRRGEL